MPPEPRTQKTGTRTGSQTRAEVETRTGFQPAEDSRVETDAELEAWVEKMLKKMEETDRRYPGRYERAQKIWDESGELGDYQ